MLNYFFILSNEKPTNVAFGVSDQGIELQFAARYSHKHYYQIFRAIYAGKYTLSILRLRPARWKSKLPPPPPILNIICMSTGQGVHEFFGMVYRAVLLTQSI